MKEVQPIKTKRDINRIKAVLSGRDLLLFTIGINSSLRISDILTIRVCDVQGDRMTLKETKTSKSKVIYINDSIRKAVKELIPSDALETDFLFPSRKGDQPISRVQAWRILNAAAERAGLKISFGTHSMRKTFAYFAYKKGTDISLLMRVLNHSSQKETLRYIGIEQENIDDVYININL